jgi:hypothetical protein
MANVQEMIDRDVVLWQCRVGSENPHEIVTVSGIFTIMDWQATERGTWFDIKRSRSDTDGIDGNWYTVDPMDLLEQVDPHAYGRILEMERESEFMAEDADKLMM